MPIWTKCFILYRIKCVILTSTLFLIHDYNIDREGETFELLQLFLLLFISFGLNVKFCFYLYH